MRKSLEQEESVSCTRLPQKTFSHNSLCSSSVSDSLCAHTTHTHTHTLLHSLFIKSENSSTIENRLRRLSFKCLVSNPLRRRKKWTRERENKLLPIRNGTKCVFAKDYFSSTAFFFPISASERNKYNLFTDSICSEGSKKKKNVNEIANTYQQGMPH